MEERVSGIMGSHGFGRLLQHRECVWPGRYLVCLQGMMRSIENDWARDATVSSSFL